MMEMTGQPVIEVLVKASVILLAAALICLGLGRLSAARKHAIWTAALLGVLALPVLITLLPAWHVGAPESLQSGAGIAAIHGAPDLSTHATQAGDAERHRGGTSKALGFAWLLGAGCVGVWLLAGHLGVRRLLIGSAPVADGPVLATFERAQGRAGAPVPVELLRHDRVRAPITVGMRTPRVVVPTEAETWPDDRLERILVHELAHVRRRDNTWNLVGRIACAAYWFHPLVWYAAHRLRVERERAADDAVLETGARPSDYAGDLFEFARAHHRPRRLEAAGLVGSSLGGRIAAILAPRARSPLSRRALTATALIAAAAALPLACATPGGAEPGAFEPGEPIAVLDADGATIELLGADVPAKVERREAFAMSLHWRVRTPFPANPDPDDLWRVFVHFDGPLPDPYGGQGARFSADHRVIASGRWWETAEIVEDRFPVLAREEHPPGEYAIYVGWFKGRDGDWKNASIIAGDPPPDPLDADRIRIGSITLE